jgi:hypothetical protein
VAFRDKALKRLTELKISNSEAARRLIMDRANFLRALHNGPKSIRLLFELAEVMEMDPRDLIDWIDPDGDEI